MERHKIKPRNMVPPIMPDLGKRFQAGQNTWSNSKCFTSMLNLCTLLPRFLGQKKKISILSFVGLVVYLGIFTEQNLQAIVTD